MENIYQHIGIQIKRRRVAGQLGRSYKLVTQSELARVCSVSFQQIQKYEKATNAVPIHNLIKIANYFDTSILEFLPAAELNQAVAKEESHSI